jgi:hypothetical protein
VARSASIEAAKTFEIDFALKRRLGAECAQHSPLRKQPEPRGQCAPQKLSTTSATNVKAK